MTFFWLRLEALLRNHKPLAACTTTACGLSTVGEIAGAETVWGDAVGEGVGSIVGLGVGVGVGVGFATEDMGGRVVA